MRSFKIYGIWLQADIGYIHTTSANAATLVWECSHASVGLAQARSNQNACKIHVHKAVTKNKCSGIDERSQIPQPTLLSF